MTLKEYKAELTNIFRRNTRSGFADWRRCNNLVYEVEKLLEKADAEMLAETRDKDLFSLVCAAFLKWGRTDKDDSGGETQGFIYCCVFEIWNKIYERENPDMPRKKMLDWFLKKMDGSVIDYMEDYLLEYMMDHFKEPKMLDRKLEVLNKRLADMEARQKAAELKDIEEGLNPKYTDSGTWEYLKAGHFKECILRIYGEQKRPIEEIRAYAKTMTAFYSQEVLADIELAYGNRDECIAIYKQLAEHESEIGRSEYNEKLKEAYKKFGLQEEYVAQVHTLLKLKRGDMDIWAEFKSLIPEAEWNETVDQLFNSFPQNDWRALGWYAAEGRYDLLMSGVEHCGPEYLKQYEDVLATRYPDRCLQILVTTANDAVDEANNRVKYRHIAKWLKWMRKYPGSLEKSAALAEQYREEYPRRTAMLEELREI